METIGEVDALKKEIAKLGAENARLKHHVNALVATFLLPATNDLTNAQRAALDNLVGAMLDVGA